MTGFAPGRIFRTLADHGVRFVTIGGFAATAHGVPRSTFDVDIVADRSAANLGRFAGAMDELGVPETVDDVGAFLTLDPRDPFDLARGQVIRIPTRFGPLDVFAFPPGAPPFEDLMRDAQVVGTKEAPVPVVSREHLIALKRASGRDKDLADVADLEREL
jgi:hypothetical protein